MHRKLTSPPNVKSKLNMGIGWRFKETRWWV